MAKQERETHKGINICNYYKCAPLCFVFFFFFSIETISRMWMSNYERKRGKGRLNSKGIQKNFSNWTKEKPDYNVEKGR